MRLLHKLGAAAIVLLVTTSAWAQIDVSNLNVTSSTYSAFFTDYRYVAGQFSVTGPSAVSIDSISVVMGNGDQAGDVQFEIRQGATPSILDSTLLGTLTASVPLNGGLVALTPSSGIVLSGSSDYWLVGKGGYGAGFPSFQIDSNGSYTGTGGTINRVLAMTSDSGETYSTRTDYGIVMQIKGSAATAVAAPEPGTFALVGTGLLSTVGVMATRRRKRA